MLSLLAAMAWKCAITAMVVIAVGRIAERAGPLLAALLMGFPVGAAPALALMALTQDEAFISHAALYGAANSLGAMFFLVGYVNGARWLGLWGCVTVGYLGWAVTTSVLGAMELDLSLTIPLLVVGFVVVRVLLPRLDLGSVPRGQGSWPYLIVRGLLAGLVVSAVVTGARVLGPSLTGLFASFPVVFASAAWLLNSLGGNRLAAATLSVSDRGMGSYVGFCLTVHLLCGPMPAFVAITAGLAVSVVVSLAIVYLVPNVARVGGQL